MEKKRKLKPAKKMTADEAQDERFSKIQSDQTFHEMPKREKKVKVDSRFKAMFYDKEFASTTANVDRHGRKVNKLKEREDLHNLYELDESEPSDNEQEKPAFVKKEKRPDFARGEGIVLSSSSDEEQESDVDLASDQEEDDGLDIHKKWGELDNGARRVEWTSRRLAVCNLDWDKMTAEDIFVALESFKPEDGKIKSIHVYLSDFGAEKLKNEEAHGPQLPVPKNIQARQTDDSDDEDDDNGEAKPEAVRAYQFDRYRFYYSVVECDTDETANAIYEACDGIQYQSTGLTLDLRFIPDDMEFEESRLRDQCFPDSVNLRKYKPNNFLSAASNSNARLDWDVGDFHRKKKVQKAFEENADMDDLSALVASGSDDEADDNAKDLLLSAASVDVYSKKGRHFEENDEPMGEESVQKPTKTKSKFKAKLVEKKKRKMAEAATHLPADVEDSRFLALYSSSDFAIDKTNPHYKGGALADRQVQEKNRRKN